MCTFLSVNRNERQTNNILSVLLNRPDTILASALKVHFDIYLWFSLNDRRIAWFHYKNCKNTEQSLRFQIHLFPPNLFPFITHS